MVNVTTETVLHNLFFGIVLDLFRFSGSSSADAFAAPFVISLTIPFALSFSIVLLLISGESANLLSIGAVDFGLVVDATVIMVENIFRRLALSSEGAAVDQKLTVVADSARGEMTKSIFFHFAAIIVVTFIPLFTLSRVEGHHFRADGENVCICDRRRI